MKRIALLLLIALATACSFLATPIALAASGLNLVSVSGKQRMLSQRTLKAYAQLKLTVAPEKASAILASSIAELRTGNATLRGGTTETGLVAGLDAQRVLIDRLAAVTSTTPTTVSLQEVLTLTDALLENAE